MTREKIVALARECGVYTGQFPNTECQPLIAFYHAAQQEAFEQAYNAADNAYATEDVLLAIREMAKEKQNAD